MTRFFGVLASASKHRAEVVPTPEPDPSCSRPCSCACSSRTGQLLRRVFAVDVTVCPRCRGRMRIEEVALTAAAIDRVLARQGLCAQPPPSPPPPRPGQLGLPGVPIH